MYGRLTSIRFLLQLSIFLLFFASCGSDDGDTITNPGSDGQEATIGAGGGSLAMDGTAELVIPAGALGGEVDFTMELNSSPAAAPSGQTMIGEALSIGPSGTTFSAPASITLDYAEAHLNGASESAVVIYTHSGSGWAPLTTVVDTLANQATAQITHLSDFACMICGTPAEGVFTVLTVTRGLMDIGGLIITDQISARFDTIVDPCNVVFPLHPDSVFCNEFQLEWNYATETFEYPSVNPRRLFIDLGEDYEFEVFGNHEVPDLTASITFPGTAPHVTNIDNNQGLSLEGFTVEWDGEEVGTTVFLSLVPAGMGQAVINIETDNDGSHEFTQADLSDLAAGTFALVLNRFNQNPITATGYDPASFVAAKVTNTTIVELGGGGGGGNIGPTGGVVIIGDSVGYLTVPPGAVSEYVEISAVENTSATPAPAGWRMVTPVFTLTVDPALTSFDLPVELLFDYDEEDLQGAPESGLTIYTDEGSGWVALSTELDMGLNDAWVNVSHFSDFVLMVEDTGAEGVYAELRLERSLTYFPDGRMLIRGDEFFARFDQFVSEIGQSPLQPGGVTFADSTCVWDDGDMRYEFIWTDFFTPGAAHEVIVAAGDGVPAFTASPVFVTDEPYVTNLTIYGTVPMSGFEVQWNGTGAGTVVLQIRQDDEPHLQVEIPNNGSYTVSAGQMAGLNTNFPVVLDLINESRQMITEEGLDSQSVMICKTYHSTILMLE